MANPSKQLNLFQQPVEIVIEQSCTVERAAALIERSKSAVYNALRQKQTYRCQVTTGEWRVSYQAKENKSILVKVTFVYSPTQKVWQLA